MPSGGRGGRQAARGGRRGRGRGRARAREEETTGPDGGRGRAGRGRGRGTVEPQNGAYAPGAAHVRQERPGRGEMRRERRGGGQGRGEDSGRYPQTAHAERARAQGNAPRNRRSEWDVKAHDGYGARLGGSAREHGRGGATAEHAERPRAPDRAPRAPRGRRSRWDDKMPEAGWPKYDKSPLPRPRPRLRHHG